MPLLISRRLPLFLALLGSLCGTHAALAENPHANHKMPTGKTARSEISYTIPDVTLINQDGKKVRLRQLLQGDKPVVMDFIFATCTTICPVMSAGFNSLQNTLGKESANVQLVSISIDPDHDSPKVMKEYLKRYQARPGWDFLTGKNADVMAVLKAFDASVPNKMAHQPLTLLRPSAKTTWTRLSGLLSSSDLLSECRQAGIINGHVH